MMKDDIKEILKPALEVLSRGEIVCIPTESSYGLAVDPTNADALRRLQELKGRDERSPFALIAGDMKQAQALTGHWPSQAMALAEQHWPGPLTLVLPPGPLKEPALIGPSGGIGVRVSSQKEVRDLALAFGNAVTATSANPSGMPAAQSVQEARGYFGSRVGHYMDGGICNALASTLVDFDAQGQLILLRQGPIALPPGE